MSRPLLVVLDASEEQVDRTARRVLGAVPRADGSLLVPLAALDGEDAGVVLRIRADGARAIASVTAHVAVAVPFFSWAVGPLLRVAARRRARWTAGALTASVEGTALPPAPRPVLGLPDVAFTPAQVQMLATAAAATALAAFASTLFGQHGQNVADAFGASDAALGNAFAVSRAGVLVALVATALADRFGRRRLVLVGIAGAAVANLGAAVAPDLVTFTACQLLVRGFVNTAAVVAAISAMEEAPEGARAYAASMLGLAAGFGFSFAVVTLPVADLGDSAWRIPFALSGATILLVRAVARRLPETARYRQVERAAIRRGRAREVFDRRYGTRFVTLGLVAFLTNVFSAPSAQLTNKYLSDVHDFSDTGIAVFRAVTLGIPGLLGVLLGGRLAESRGRRHAAVVALLVGTSLQIAFFLGGGPALWVTSATAVVASAVAGVALGTLGPELFPTEVRGTSSAMLLVVGVFGSATGLVLAGHLSDPFGGLGRSIALCGVAALLAGALVVPRLPESRGRALDDVSPSEHI